jgi:periplasmic protein CpxP/Spy
MKPFPLRSTLAVALFLAPILASAQSADGPPPANQRQPRREGGPQTPRMGADRTQRTGRAMANLGLTDVQKADLRKAKESARRDQIRKSTDLKIARMDLNSLMNAERVDEKAVSAKLAEVQAAQGALLKLRVDTRLAMARILTPEQQKKAREMRAGGRNTNRQRMRRSQGGRAGRTGQRSRRGFGNGARPADDYDLDLDDDYLDDVDEGVIRPNFK